MKRSMITLSVLAILSLSACADCGSWTPMSSGRTAGEGQMMESAGHKADDSFSGSLRK